MPSEGGGESAARKAGACSRGEDTQSPRSGGPIAQDRYHTGSLGPISAHHRVDPLLRQVHLEQVTQELLQMGFEGL